MTESEDETKLPAVPESRVSRIKRIIGALSDFEQDELSSSIQVNRMKEYQMRLSEPKNAIAFGMHTGIWGGAFFGLFAGTIAGTAAIYSGGVIQGMTTFLLTLVLGGSAFGLGLALYMLLLMKVMTFLMAKNLDAEKSALFQVRKIEIPVPFAETVELSLTTLASKKGWRIESINREEGTVRAMTSASVRSPGEIVGVKVVPVSETGSIVSVYSKALFTALDFGKNKQNVTMLAQEIEEAGTVHSILKLQ